jgi:Tol biopolymer transport system component
MLKKIIWVLIILVLLIGCEKRDSSTGPDDSDLYTISIVNPLNNAEINSGTIVPIIVEISERSEIICVKFFINDSLIHTDGDFPYEYYWDTAGITGNQNIYATGYDNEGNEFNSETITISLVMNEYLVFLTDLGNYDIYLFDFSDSTFQNITNTPDISENYPRISPDYQKILFQREINDWGELCTINLDGTGLTEVDVFPSSQIDVGVGDWAPDGEKIVFISFGQVFVYDMVSHQTTQITFDSNEYREPKWTPDGEWIGFYSLVPADNHIHLIRPDGTDQHEVPNIGHMDCSRHSFSKDSQSLVFIGRYYAGQTYDIFRIDLDGSNFMNLTNTPSVDEKRSSWSPNDDLITGDNYQIFLDLPEDQNFPHWR